MAMEDDATVQLPHPAAGPGLVVRPGRRRLWPWLAGAGGGLALLGGGVALWQRRPDVAPEATPPVAPPAGVPTVLVAPPLLDMAGLLAHPVNRPEALRWAANPLVWVLVFPSLESQGGAMNRAAALLEKARTPRDRLLDDAELAAAIAADGRTPANWYFGHNYRGSDLVRIRALAAARRLALYPIEEWVEEQVLASRRLEPSRDSAFITLPALGPQVDADLRRSILLHELGHGQFITMPLFAAHVMRVWAQDFTEAERAAMRRFLGSEGYDTGQDELMANEAMAYLLYTPDRRFFEAGRDLGWSEAQAERLRAAFRAGAPPEP